MSRSGIAKVIKKLGVNLDKLAAFILLIEDGYSLAPPESDQDDPKKLMRLKPPTVQYHNRLHVTDVLQCVYYFLSATQMFPKLITYCEAFIALTAAAVHDFKHGIY